MRQNQPQNRQRSRSRGNQNRNQSRNQLNRSMESNGPEVRIRGTASHIADKYTQFARDAQTSGDTVAAESYWQHAEHYNRLIAVAQAQQAEEQAKRDEERAKRQEEHEKRQEARRQDRDNRGDRRDDDDDSDDDNRGKDRQNQSRDRNEDREDVRADESGDGKHKAVKKGNGSDDQPAAAKGDGPQPDIEGEPAEVALAEKPSGTDGNRGDDKPEKPKRAKTTRKPAPIAEDASELPSFVTGD